MKKIMFNDKYGLTEAVLEGRKTQTRRVINLSDTDMGYHDTVFDWDLRESVIIERYAKYKVGEVVAVAQKYYDFRMPNGDVTDKFYKLCCEHYMPLECLSSEAGATNKMFVKAELMPHHIRITKIRVERLQDISREDCLKEGIYEFRNVYSFKDYKKDEWEHHSTPFGAYAALIDKVSGKGTWESNPWVFVYDFELED